VARVKVHEQVRERIEKLVADGALRPGHKLPNENELVWRIQRVRCADAEPIAVETCYIPCGLLSEEGVANLGNGSLYDLLAQRGRAPVSSEQSIEAALLNPEEAAFAQGQPRAPGPQIREALL
jgi:DNA-binding GntR family transcriptional regulator